MKTYLRIILAFSLLLPTSMQAVQSATARMWCWSVKFGRGSGGWGALWSVDLTAISSGVNGELMPVDASRSHWATVLFNDETMAYDPIPGSMYLDLPDLPDSNDDGFDDFFDVSRSVSGSSQGNYSVPGFGSGQVTATWSRPAGSKNGTCALNFQQLGTFTHPFEILEYRGTLEYVPHTSTVTGLVSMAQSGVPQNTLKGAMVFRKNSTDPFNELVLQPGHMTNAQMQSLVFWDDVYWRYPEWRTNYFGFVSFTDGDLSTGEVDYDLWIMSIDDLNDTDGDGIPDFSDTPSTAPVRKPVLGLSAGPAGLALEVSATVGTTWEVQQAATIAGPWTKAGEIAITTDPQVFSLPAPPGTAFWRLLKP
jgi:hypothetical protein